MFYIFASPSVVTEANIFAAVTAAHKLSVELYTQQAVISQEITLTDDYLERMVTLVPVDKKVKVGPYYLSVVYFHEDRLAVPTPNVTLMISDLDFLKTYPDVATFNDNIISDMSEGKFSLIGDNNVSMDEIRFALNGRSTTDRVSILTRELMSLNHELTLHNYITFYIDLDVGEHVPTLVVCNSESTFINKLINSDGVAELLADIKNEMFAKFRKSGIKLVEVEKQMGKMVLTAEGAALVGGKEGGTLTERPDKYSLCSADERCFSVDSEFLRYPFDACRIQDYVALRPEHWTVV